MICLIALVGRWQEVEATATWLRPTYFLLRSEVLRGRPMQTSRRNYPVSKRILVFEILLYFPNYLALRFTGINFK